MTRDVLVTLAVDLDGATETTRFFLASLAMHADQSEFVRGLMTRLLRSTNRREYVQ